MQKNLQSSYSLIYIIIHIFTHYTCSHIHHTPGVQVDSMREAVFIVSPKMLNLGSLVPMRPLIRVRIGRVNNLLHYLQYW